MGCYRDVVGKDGEGRLGGDRNGQASVALIG